MSGALKTTAIQCWSSAWRNAGACDMLLKSRQALRNAIATHQKLLLENGIGKEVSERDRIRVNARRVGLQAPMFADEAETTFSDILGHGMGNQQQQQGENNDNNNATAEAQKDQQAQVSTAAGQ